MALWTKEERVAHHERMLSPRWSPWVLGVCLRADGYRQDCTCHLKQCRITPHWGTTLGIGSMLQEGPWQPPGHLRDPIGTLPTWCRGYKVSWKHSFTYARLKVSVYLSMSSIYLVIHLTLQSYSEEENSLGVFRFSMFKKSVLSWDVMDSMCKEKTDRAHCDYASALVSSCKITYASAGLIGLPWQCCLSNSMSNQRPRFTENFQSGTLPCASLSVLNCDISISWTSFLLIVGEYLFNKTADLVENRTPTSSYPQRLKVLIGFIQP